MICYINDNWMSSAALESRRRALRREDDADCGRAGCAGRQGDRAQVRLPGPSPPRSGECVCVCLCVCVCEREREIEIESASSPAGQHWMLLLPSQARTRRDSDSYLSQMRRQKPPAGTGAPSRSRAGAKVEPSRWRGPGLVAPARTRACPPSALMWRRFIHGTARRAT